jgi:hypothetical protein
MAKSSVFGIAGNVFTYSVVAIVLVGGLLYLTGYVQLPFGMGGEGFEDAEQSEEFTNDGTNDGANDGANDGEQEEEETPSKPFSACDPDDPDCDTDENFVGGYGGSGSEYASADESNGRNAVPSTDHANCYTRDGLNPSDLLPKASPEAAQFLASNPPSTGNPDNRNLLQAGYHIGTDTVCQSNKNPNLQLRSDPPISRSGAQPVFNASTIPFVQNNRRVLEVGDELNPKGCADFKGDSALP